jgi:hypothetical protein
MEAAELKAMQAARRLDDRLNNLFKAATRLDA